MEPLRTNIPARLDRLPWSRFHLLIIIALGVTWTLDGLEVTIVGAISGVLQDRRTLHLSAQEIGALASFYLTGAVAGALLFGWLTDRFGRRKIFYVTLAFYLAGVALSAVSWNFVSFAGFRLITGAGIGGEYAAVFVATKIGCYRALLANLTYSAAGFFRKQTTPAAPTQTATSCLAEIRSPRNPRMAGPLAWRTNTQTAPAAADCARTWR